MGHEILSRIKCGNSSILRRQEGQIPEPDLTLKAPITTAADDKLCDTFPNFREKYVMLFHEKCMPADNSHEISCLICYF